MKQDLFGLTKERFGVANSSVAMPRKAGTDSRFQEGSAQSVSEASGEAGVAVHVVEGRCGPESVGASAGPEGRVNA